VEGLLLHGMQFACHELVVWATLLQQVQSNCSCGATVADVLSISRQQTFDSSFERYLALPQFSMQFTDH